MASPTVTALNCAATCWSSIASAPAAPRSDGFAKSVSLHERLANSMTCSISSASPPNGSESPPGVPDESTLSLGARNGSESSTGSTNGSSVPPNGSAAPPSPPNGSTAAPPPPNGSAAASSSPNGSALAGVDGSEPSPGAPNGSSVSRTNGSSPGPDSAEKTPHGQLASSSIKPILKHRATRFRKTRIIVPLSSFMFRRMVVALLSV